MNSLIIQSDSATSPSSNKLGAKVQVPLSDTIPVIFIPGIMGSNIRTIKGGKPVWRLGNAMIPLGTIVSQGSKNPSQLQEELDPEKTEVDDRGAINVDPSLGLSKAELKKRGWGTVHSASYGEILSFLQITLNNVINSENTITRGYISENDKPVGWAFKINKARVEWESLLDTRNFQNWNPLKKPLVVAEKSEIDLLKNFTFPVYAMGYNWLRSNEDAAKKISEKLNKIKSELGGRFHTFIIVSHSMGGLVTRRLAQINGNDIAGVVHGVMPADGAAAAYRRLVAGSSEGGFESAVAAVIIGNKTEHVTAVLSNSPGGLELLPNSVYNNKKPWLILKGKNSLNQEIKVEMPSKDSKGNVNPYDQIYKADNVWWEMIKAELIDPAGINKEKYPNVSLKNIYKERINKVREFHDRILDKYHHHTYVNYGHGKLSFGILSWTLDKPMSGLTRQKILTMKRESYKEILKHNDLALNRDYKNIQPGNPKYMENSGCRYIKLSDSGYAKFEISSQDSKGDGTVPWQSGSAPLRDKNNVKQVFLFQNIDHQGSYGNKFLKQTVLYSIVRIIKDNNIRPRYR